MLSHLWITYIIWILKLFMICQIKYGKLIGPYFYQFVDIHFLNISAVSKQSADTAAAVLHLKTHEFSMHEHLIRPTTKYTESLPLCLAYSFVFGFGSPRPHRLWKFSVFSVWVKTQWRENKFWGKSFLFLIWRSKIQIFWEGHKNLKKISQFVWTLLSDYKSGLKIYQNFWHSQNIWSLLDAV